MGIHKSLKMLGWRRPSYCVFFMSGFVCDRKPRPCVWNIHEGWGKQKGGLIEPCWQGEVSKSQFGMVCRCGDWLSHPQMEDGAHRKRINCLISARWGTGLLLADGLLRKKVLGGKEMGIEEENESRETRQQMNLHLCSEAIGSKKTSQTTAEVRLWSHTSAGLPLWRYPLVHFRLFSFLLGIEAERRPVIMSWDEWHQSAASCQVGKWTTAAVVTTVHFSNMKSVKQMATTYWNEWTGPVQQYCVM